MNKYDNYTKEELLKIIKQQENELKYKKYGLVWDSEREPEQVVLDCENSLPILKHITSKTINTNNEEDNILIEGDNYHALSVLNYTHKEKIDVIYIDPPYNTGKEKEWKYNDKFIDDNDGFRHSKWLNLFEKRLKLSKNLLKQNGVILISIDDNEMAQAKLLCDKIFDGISGKKDSNLLGVLVWDLGTGTQAGHFVRSHEYVLVYAKNKSLFPNFKGGEGIIKHSALKKISKKNPASEFTFPKGFRFDAEDNVELLDSWGGSEKTTLISGEMKAKDGKLLEEVTLYAGWAMKSQMTQWIYHDKNNTYDTKGQKVIEFYFNKNGVLTYRKERSVSNPPTVLRSIASTKTGSEELKNLFDGDSVFDFPKPSVFIDELLGFFDKNITVLDYFAGTGTTAHSVMKLNQKDNGNRKFILCTNNENNICTDVTYPRISKVIKGYKRKTDNEKIEGLGGNLQYFKTSLLKKSNNRHQTKLNLTNKCSEMLCLKENIFNLEKKFEDFKIYSSHDKLRYLCIYFNTIDDSFNEFLDEIRNIYTYKIVYMFSDDLSIDKEPFKDIPNIKIEAIPQKILDIYKQLIKMNIPIKPTTIFTDLTKAKKRIFDEKEKDDGAFILRIVLEKTIQKIAQNSGVSILRANGKEESVENLNNTLKNNDIFSKVTWEENKTYMAIGNHAAHGDYDEYDLKQIMNFYRYTQSLIDGFNIG